MSKLDELNHIGDGRILATKQELIDWAISCLPEKQELTTHWTHAKVQHGFNQAIEEMERNINE